MVFSITSLFCTPFTHRSWLFLSPLHLFFFLLAPPSGRVPFSFLSRRSTQWLDEVASTMQEEWKVMEGRKTVGGGWDRVMSPEEEESRHKRTRARHPRPRRPSSLFRGRTVRQNGNKEKVETNIVRKRTGGQWKKETVGWMTPAVRWPCHRPWLSGCGDSDFCQLLEQFCSITF